MRFEGTCLVTGALGQDGFILCRRLRELKAQVAAVIRPGGHHGARRDALTDCGCQIIEQDLGDAVAISDMIKAIRPNYLFHLAASHHSSDSGLETPEVWRSMLSINVVATEALARAVTEINRACSFVYASSSQIWTA